MVNQGIAVTTLRVTWNAAESAIAYESEWRRDNGNWIPAHRTSTQGFEIPNIYAGRYQARVRAINAAEISSLWANAPETHLKGKEGSPPAPLAFRTVPIIFGIQLDWGFAPQTDDTLKTEIQYSKTNDGEGLMLLADIPYPQRTHTMQGLAAGVAFYFRARLVDKSGNQSPWTVFIRGESSSDTNWIIDAAGKEFLSNKAGQRLQSQMDFNSEAIMEIAAVEGAIVQRQLKVNGDLKAEILHVQTTQVTDRQAFAEDMKKVQAEVGENAAAVQTKATAVFDIDGNGYGINYVGAGVKYNNQFYKAGMVIGAEVKNGQVTTSIGFNAENFGWFNPASGKMEPFMMAKNGQLFVREAFFDKTTIQKLLIGAEIKSVNYIPGKSGFYWNMQTGQMENIGSDSQGKMKQTNTTISIADEKGRLRGQFGKITGVF